MIVLQSSGDGALARVVQCAGQEAYRIDGDLQGDVAGDGHLAGVADQAEPGHIGASVDVEPQHLLAGPAVEGQHGLDGGFHMPLGSDAALQGGGNHPSAQPLGEDQHIAGSGAGVGLEPQRVHQAGDRIAEQDLVAGDAVASKDGATGFPHLLGATLQDLFEVGEVALGGVGQHGERGDGASTHGVHIAQRVGGGDCAEGVRIVDDRGEKVYRLHQGELRRQLVHAGIVGGIKPDQHVVVGPAGHGG